MYVPKIYNIIDEDITSKFISDNNFADLVTFSNGEITSNKVPFYLDKKNMILYGHLGRTNPQLTDIEDSEEVLVIFSGPHCYISPQWYQSENMVPTWNFQTVQVRGSANTVGSDSLVSILKKITDFHESKLPTQWSMDSLDRAKLEKMLNMIVGFKIEIREMKFKEKMSQNRRTADQESVIKFLKAYDSYATAKVAEIMSQNLESS